MCKSPHNTNDLIIYHPDLRIGGAEKQIVLLIKGLLNKGYRIVLVLNWVVGPYLDELPKNSNLEIVNLEKKNYIALLFKLYILWLLESMVRFINDRFNIFGLLGW